MRHVGSALTVVALPGGIALTAATAGGARRLLVGSTSAGSDPAGALAGLACLLAALLAGWLTLALLLTLVSHLPGELGRAARRVRDRITPALVRRWAVIALGASVTASVLPGTAVAADVRTEPGGTDASPGPGWLPPPTAEPTTTAAPDASALPGPGWAPAPRPGGDPSATSTGTRRSTTPTPTPTPTPTTADVPDRLSGPGWTPRRPPARQRTDAGLLVGRGLTPTGGEVVVHRGDSLWSIAAAHLGPGATSAEIALAWPRWHTANHDRIGPDPDRLLPGTRLTPPTHHHAPGTAPVTKGTP